MNKKGFSLWVLPGIVITLGVIAILFAVTSTVLQEQKDDVSVRENVAVSANETFVLLNCTTGTTALSTTSKAGFLSVANSTITFFNRTMPMLRDDFLVNLTAPSVCLHATANANMTDHNNTNMNISYSWQRFQPNFDYNATLKGQEGLDTVASWQDNIGQIIGAAVILALIFGVVALIGMRRS